MPMMAVYEQNDARSSARLLASMTLRELEGADAVDVTVLLNMFRLLDGFRAHDFYGVHEDEGAADDEFGTTSMVPSGERRFADVRVALKRSVATFDGADPDGLLQEIEDVLRATAYPEEEPADPAAIEKTKSFLGSLIANLQYA